MEFSEWRKEADFYTGKLSDLNRQLALAGIAIVWIFNSEKLEGMPFDLTAFLFYAVIALLIDLLHYLYGAIVYSIYIRRIDAKGSNSDAESEPKMIWKLITYLFLLAKVGYVIAAYFHLIRFVVYRLHGTVG